MAEILAASCECGYGTVVLDGGLFSGAVGLFVCDDCRELVGARTWSRRVEGDRPAGAVEPRCPNCGGDELAPWRDEKGRPGPCPRCGGRVTLVSQGIAD